MSRKKDKSCIIEKESYEFSRLKTNDLTPLVHKNSFVIDVCIPKKYKNKVQFRYKMLGFLFPKFLRIRYSGEEND